MIRWITERLGTSPWEDCQQNAETTVIDVRILLDAKGNSEGLIHRFVEEAVDHWRAGQTVVICCDYGVSRSNAVAAGVLSVLRGKSYDDAILAVIAATGERQIKLDVVMDIRAALDEQSRAGSRLGTFIIGSESFLGRSLKCALGADHIECSGADDATLSANPVLLDALLGEQAPECLLFCWHPTKLDTSDAAGTLISNLRNVLEVCRLRQMRIVFVSGHQVFAARNDDATCRCTEDEEPKPAGAAGDGLYLSEQLVRIYSLRNDLEALVIRPTYLYGPNDEHPSFLNTFMHKAITSSNIDTHEFANGAPCIDLLHVDDCARGVVQAIRNGLSGILHLASGNYIMTSELADEVLKAAGSLGNVRVFNLPGKCSQTMLDASKASCILGWKPEVLLEDGLRDTLEHIRLNTQNMKRRGSQ